MKYKIILLFAVILLSQTVYASDHYSFEHAEEMRLSGRIDWQEYGPEAFNNSIQENKPIFLLLTAPTWCYWCHVYTSDDYIYHSEIYPLINENFIPIYVDADKRQDLTRQFLEGGWPSTTIFTPSRERLFGYSGPRAIQFMKDNLNQAIEYVNTTGFANQPLHNYEKIESKIYNETQLTAAINSFGTLILQAHDPINGGFGSGQKFPQGRTLDYALEQYEETNNAQWLNLVEVTLDGQYTELSEIETNYNLFDPVEGGFHRYGTTPEWTPPHYEKMLYDNARLLKAYHHLTIVNPENETAQKVVSKTIEFIKTNWYDPQGGFYGNSDVHGEDSYYGLIERPEEKPRVEKTKYSDWNSEAIITYLYLWKTTENPEYKEISEKTLDFFAKEMVTENGAYHYLNENGEKGVRGTLLDNSNLLLAFIEGYEVLGKEKYLQTAKIIADYSLNNLYDWNSGGFFERNSPDTNLYAPGEHINLTKPNQENGIISYGLLKLYTHLDETAYLNAGIKSLGSTLEATATLDRGYYHLKAAEYIIENNLMDEYRQLEDEVILLEQSRKEDYWLDKLLSGTLPAPPSTQQTKPDFKVDESGLEKTQPPLAILLLVALLAGLISFVSPCTLPILPAYLANSFKTSHKNIKAMTLSFFLGLSLIFTLLGMSASIIGNFIQINLTLFTQVAGMAIMGFGVLILMDKGFKGLTIKTKKPINYARSFIFGASIGLAWTPCIGPILGAILLIASTTQSVFVGGLLLFVYSIGLAFPLLMLSVYLNRLDKNKSKVWKVLQGKELHFKVFNKKIEIHTSSLISGILFLIIGYLIFSGVLYGFNQYVVSTDLQQSVFAIEDELLKLI